MSARIPYGGRVCGHPRSRTYARAVSLVALLAAMSTACGDDGGTEAITTVATTATAAPTPVTAAAPASTVGAPVTYADQATYVSGTIADFTIDQGTVTDDGNGASHSRGGSLSYTMIANDPRAGGKLTATWNSDRWGVEDNGALVQWGDAVLTNEGGTWEGSYAGALASDYGGDVVTRWLVGTGAYEGLTFYWWLAGYEGGIDGAQWYGIIYPGNPPPTVVMSTPPVVDVSKYPIVLVSTEPADGDILSTTPDEIVLYFQNRLPAIEPIVVLQDENGEPQQIGQPIAIDNRTALRVRVLHALPAGVYTVTYTVRATKAAEVAGEFSFTLRAP